jgi:hypothetical protein
VALEPQKRRWPLLVESLAVALSPGIGFFVLRMRAMSPVQLPDPSMHTIYAVDPSQMFVRYAAAFAPTARMREGAQAGFLVLARLAYLGFGALPGFFVTRYALALIAVVPAYLLMRRLYGIPAGVLAIVVLLSCPVVITAWGTDYPDCAVVSYVVGAVACLAMPGRQRWRAGWLALAATLLTLAVWSHGMGVVLAATTVVIYGLVRLVRERRRLVIHALLLGVVAVAATFLLMVASRLVLGQFDFINPTLKAAAFLNTPAQVRQWHSSNWRWALYVAYLLVPPAVIAAFAVTFARRLRAIPTPQLFVGLACAGQFGVFAYLQFGYHVQTLEMHFFSSTIWGVVCLALAVVLAEMSRPIWARPVAGWLPVALVLAVPLAYEADPNTPAFGWWPVGAALALVPVLVALVMRFWSQRDLTQVLSRTALVVAVALSVVATTGSTLELTVAPRPSTPALTGLAIAGDPEPSYNTALGGNATEMIDWYQVCASLPGFVGDPSYRGEQLLMWFFWDVPLLLEPVGIFHEGFNSLGFGFPVLTPGDRDVLATRRPAELLLLGIKRQGFQTAFRDLGSYGPELVRTTVLRHGIAVLHVWLIILRSFAPRSIWLATATTRQPSHAR